tara:strand:+ start:128 stop:235 length:108 start_codon:yes stop_codon:yes gene_type:complete
MLVVLVVVSMVREMVDVVVELDLVDGLVVAEAVVP